jgi:hypothetical protein
MCARTVFEASSEIPEMRIATFGKARAFTTAWLARRESLPTNSVLPSTTICGV